MLDEGKLATVTELQMPCGLDISSLLTFFAHWMYWR